MSDDGRTERYLREVAMELAVKAGLGADPVRTLRAAQGFLDFMRGVEEQNGEPLILTEAKEDRLSVGRLPLHQAVGFMTRSWDTAQRMRRASWKTGTSSLVLKEGNFCWEVQNGLPHYFPTEDLLADDWVVEW